MGEREQLRLVLLAREAEIEDRRAKEGQIAALQGQLLALTEQLQQVSPAAWREPYTPFFTHGSTPVREIATRSR